jgi:dUTP pyrophosphatase
MTPAIATGDFVAQHLNDGDVPDEHIQPNGVDLTIQEMYRTSGQAHFFEDDYEKPNRTPIQPVDSIHEEGVEVYSIVPGVYPVVYGEKVEIPDGYVGRVYPRSRLMRCGLHLTSALWDQGYEGIGEGLLKVPTSVERVTIPTDMAIAQMSFIEAESADDYEGSHQEERLMEGSEGVEEEEALAVMGQ